MLLAGLLTAAGLAVLAGAAASSSVPAAQPVKIKRERHQR
ncbi:hypothetical protein LAPL110952_11670 [Lactiplantibacillus plajomi]